MEEQRMNTYEFALILDRFPTDDESEKIYECGCDDGTIASCKDRHSVSFDRKAESLEAAIKSAVANIKAAGFDVIRCELDSDALLTVAS